LAASSLGGACAVAVTEEEVSVERTRDMRLVLDIYRRFRLASPGMNLDSPVIAGRVGGDDRCGESERQHGKKHCHCLVLTAGW
jgi:hypothetical protein